MSAGKEAMNSAMTELNKPENLLKATKIAGEYQAVIDQAKKTD